MPIGVDDLSDGTKAPIGQHERLFHGFLEAAPDAVVIIDGEGVIAQVNSQTEKLFGYPREELVGRPLEMLMPARYRGSHVAETRAYAANPHPRPMGRDLDLFGLRKDGHEFPIDVTISPLPPERGLLIASIIRDMTTHRRLEEELRQRTLELEEADRQKDNYLSAVAHELRSPLSVLTLGTQVLRLSQAENKIREQTLGSFERQTAHMARMIEDLLDLTRVRNGTLTLHREVVDLRTVLIDAVEMGQPLVESRQQHLEVAPFMQPVVGERRSLSTGSSDIELTLQRRQVYAAGGTHRVIGGEGGRDRHRPSSGRRGGDTERDGVSGVRTVPTGGSRRRQQFRWPRNWVISGAAAGRTAWGQRRSNQRWFEQGQRVYRAFAPVVEQRGRRTLCCSRPWDHRLIERQPVAVPAAVECAVRRATSALMPQCVERAIASAWGWIAGHCAG